MRKFGMSLFAGLMMMGAVACDDGVADTAQNAAICERVCKQIGACVGSTDTGNCRKDCVDKSENDNFEAQASKCSDCVDNGDKCVNKAIECSSECAGVAAVAAQNQN
ncbi:MAG: hypothetical protein JWN48_1294 [Myxococcaceae bacterium]|nr:hypothetical protein [Myxococcaceae bacterium]